MVVFAACGDDSAEDGQGGEGAQNTTPQTGAGPGTMAGPTTGTNTGGNTTTTGSGGGANIDPDPIVLEDFSDLRTNALLPTPENPPQPLWYPYYQSSNPQVQSGILSVTVQGAPQIYFRPLDDNGWYFIRTLIESGTWSDNGFNRLRFRVKQPDGLELLDPGRHNVEWASFLHVGSTTNGPWTESDDNNWHFYHYLDIPSDGLWHEVIIDTYPDHQRGELGGEEQGDQEFPEGGSTFNYFSMMTSFYYDLPYASTLGMVEMGPVSLFYEDNSTVPLDQVRSLNAAFDPTSSAIKLGWMRRKDQSGHPYEVRWSTAPITDFDAANLGGEIDAPDTDVYNGVRFDLASPELASHDVVWVAIRPGGTDLFRQIAVRIE